MLIKYKWLNKIKKNKKTCKFKKKIKNRKTTLTEKLNNTENIIVKQQTEKIQKHNKKMLDQTNMQS